MFHWICPECGQEIAPGVKECPVCEPQAIALSTPSGGPSVAAAPAPAPAERQSDVLHPEVIVPPQAVLQPKTFDRPKPRVVLDAIPLETRPLMPDVPLGTSPVELPDPLMDRPMPDKPTPDRPPDRSTFDRATTDRPAEPETFADRLADLAQSLHGEHIPYGAPRVFQESAAPGPRVGRVGHTEQPAQRTPVILDISSPGDVTFHGEETQDWTPAWPLLASPPGVLLLAEPQPPAVAARIPIDQVFRPRTSQHAARAPRPMGAEPAPASGTIRLPDAAGRAAAPALASFQDYHQAADRQMRPAEYEVKLAPAKAPATVTLPGPTLPRELMSLQAAGLVPIRRCRRLRERPSNRFSDG